MIKSNPLWWTQLTERERSDRFQATLWARLIESGRYAPVLYAMVFGV